MGAFQHAVTLKRAVTHACDTCIGMQPWGRGEWRAWRRCLENERDSGPQM